MADNSWTSGGNGSYWTNGSEYFTPYQDIMGHPDQNGNDTWSSRAMGGGAPGGSWIADYDQTAGMRDFDLASMGINLGVDSGNYSGKGMFSTTAPNARWEADVKDDYSLMKAFSQGPGLVLGAGFGLSSLAGLAGAGAAGTAAAGAGSVMPAAIPELASANALAGGVTAASGLNNAVTMGLAGTSGAAAAGAVGSGFDPGSENMFNFEGTPTDAFSPSSFNSSDPFNFAGDQFTNFNLSGNSLGDMFSQFMPGGDYSATAGMTNLGGVGGVAGSGLQESSFFDKLMKSFGSQKDPLKAVQGALRLYQGLQQNKQQKSFLESLQANQFPHASYQSLAAQFADPAARMQMLQSNPAYQAAEAYVKQAQARKNARSGNINSGYGDAVMASVLGENASKWEQQMFGQIKDLSGMSMPNSYAAAGNQSLQNMFTNNLNTAGSVADALRSNQGFFPEMFKTFFS